MSDYPVPVGSLERELVIKKSRFIARAFHVSSREDVKAAAEMAWKDHPDARHVCWAYQIGRPGAAAEAGMNDDGEPSGTAGKPILNVIQHKPVGDVAVIVIRYFGGIKLGAGGLVRAYSGATEQVMAELPTRTAVRQSLVVVTMGFADEQPLRHWCDEHQSELFSVEYGRQVSATVQAPSDHIGSLKAFCKARQLAYQDPEH